jgi:3-phenylpropionate/trans-cinnamate dioxygenase ferredoxin subunit
MVLGKPVMIWWNRGSTVPNYTKLDPEMCDFIAVATLRDLPNGGRLFIEIDNEYFVLFNIGGNIYAIADLCSHDDGPLGDGEVEGHTIACPRHGARFDLQTGEALTFPAVESIPAYPVRVRDGSIEIGIPKE